MEWIGIIASVASIIAAVASIVAAKVGIASFRYTKQMSKGNIKKQIKAKENQIRDIDVHLVNRFGIYDTGCGRAWTSLDFKKRKLQEEIEDLRLEL